MIAKVKNSKNGAKVAIAYLIRVTVFGMDRLAAVRALVPMQVPVKLGVAVRTFCPNLMAHGFLPCLILL